VRKTGSSEMRSLFFICIHIPFRVESKWLARNHVMRHPIILEHRNNPVVKMLLNNPNSAMEEVWSAVQRDRNPLIGSYSEIKSDIFEENKCLLARRKSLDSSPRSVLIAR
jgi:hypothetical protein